MWNTIAVITPTLIEFDHSIIILYIWYTIKLYFRQSYTDSQTHFVSNSVHDVCIAQSGRGLAHRRRLAEHKVR